MHSGADLALLVREAQEACLRDSIAHNKPLIVTKAHFEIALGRVLPSVTQKDERRYDALNQSFINSRQRVVAPDAAPSTNSDKPSSSGAGAPAPQK